MACTCHRASLILQYISLCDYLYLSVHFFHWPISTPAKMPTQLLRQGHSHLTGQFFFFYISVAFLLYLFQARPCSSTGRFFSKPYPPPEPVHPIGKNPWAPFDSRVAFEWAHERFVELKASKRQIGRGIDLWRAVLLEQGVHVDPPWNSDKDFYATIDSIQDGHAPWITRILRYTGPKPTEGPIPAWMEEEYELNTRNVLCLLEIQISNSEFNGKFDYVPFKEFNRDGNRVYSNLMSGQWAFQEAVCLI